MAAPKKMPLVPTGDKHFSSVKKARELLKSRAESILSDYLMIVKSAAADGEYKAALDGLQWLIDHTPAEDGTRIVDVSIDKPVPVEQYSAPAINIGFALGGVGAAALTEHTIDAAIVKSNLSKNGD